jgi:predicted Zn-dependent protease with MMP-like domain
MNITEAEFEAIITEAIDRIPEKYAERLDNVHITWEEEPSEEQRKRLKLHCNQTLFGLYEGIPLTQRGAGYNLVLPDRITIFKKPIEAVTTSIAELREQVGRTLWHEVAHYFGLDHERIHALERRERDGRI